MGNLEIDLITKKNDFSFTFTIPSFKNVRYKGNSVPYGKLSNSQQYDFLEEHLHNCCYSKFDDIKWVYEQHKEADNRLHIHGFIKGTYEEMVINFRHDFYSNYKINCSYKSYIKYSDIQRTIKDINYFERYCDKFQHEITYYMRVIEDKKHAEELDKGVKIETNKRDIPADYINSLTEHLETKNSADTYMFGKKHTNFIIEI